MSNEVVNGADVGQLSSGHGDSEVSEDNKPLLQSELSYAVKKENVAEETSEPDVEGLAQQYASEADVKPRLTSTLETCADDMDLKKFFGMVHVKFEFCRIRWVWPKTRPGPRKHGRLGLKSGPARPEPFTCHY